MNEDSGIIGIKELLQGLPREMQFWHCFGQVHEFKYYKIYDYEEWHERYDAEIVLSDRDEKVKIWLKLKNVIGDIKLHMTQSISGLNIRNLRKECGFESGVGFHLYDFENEDISVYCEEIEAKML